jgi:hypothetical protein
MYEIFKYKKSIQFDEICKIQFLIIKLIYIESNFKHAIYVSLTTKT